ncbi:3'(2'),5'-bisphosphate nucleotidase CysQ [Algihabitans albus]|uniref:3'(2'),5'-bisphosphate nucleotidase CysQ n=1 Tax=Algihabitans albus TaxID=2164067 RepID=UPI0035D1220A
MSHGNPSTTQDDDLLAVLRMLAERAGKIALAYYAKGGEIEVRDKSDASPVTEADEACEAFLLDALAKLTPDIPVVSEEAAAQDGLPDIDVDQAFWLVDPLDGTREFISRNGEFTVNVALIKEHRPVAGVVHAPAMAMTWCGGFDDEGRGHASFSETDRPPMPIEARPAPDAGETVVASRRHGSGEELEGFLAARKIAQRVTAGSSLKFCLLASGKADLYPRFGRTMEWDTAAGQAVLAAAGGRVETLDGQPLRYGKAGFANPNFIAYGRTRQLS